MERVSLFLLWAVLPLNTYSFFLLNTLFLQVFHLTTAHHQLFLLCLLFMPICQCTYVLLKKKKNSFYDFLHLSHLSDLFTTKVTHTHLYIYTIFITKNSIPLSHFSTIFNVSSTFMSHFQITRLFCYLSMNIFR